MIMHIYALQLYLKGITAWRCPSRHKDFNVDSGFTRITTTITYNMNKHNILFFMCDVRFEYIYAYTMQTDARVLWCISIAPSLSSSSLKPQQKQRKIMENFSSVLIRVFSACTKTTTMLIFSGRPARVQTFFFYFVCFSVYVVYDRLTVWIYIYVVMSIFVDTHTTYRKKLFLSIAVLWFFKDR